jgi:hypothetical protein
MTLHVVVLSSRMIYRSIIIEDRKKIRSGKWDEKKSLLIEFLFSLNNRQLILISLTYSHSSSSFVSG